jgi:hypothetical protein
MAGLVACAARVGVRANATCRTDTVSVAHACDEQPVEPADVVRAADAPAASVVVLPLVAAPRRGDPAAAREWECYADADTDTDTDTDTECESVEDADTDTDTDAECESVEDADTDTDVDAVLAQWCRGAVRGVVVDLQRRLCG